MSVSVQWALEAGKLYVAFQPVVDLETMSVFGYEALARSEISEFAHPMDLLRAAMRAGFLGELGRGLRHMALHGCPTHPLLLNIHPNEFDEGWLVRPDDPIAFHDHDVYLEITESVPLSHYRYCHSVLREIRSKGVRIAIDDLGAGYSNFKYIADLEPDLVKLDRELIAGVTRQSRLHKLVSSIVTLCNDQGARVVAEGIETEDELNAVIDTGAHYGQGFYLARPARHPPTIHVPPGIITGNY